MAYSDVHGRLRTDRPELLDRKMVTEMTLLEIKTFFESGGKKFDSLKDFRAQWEQLSESDKAQLKAGLSDNTFNY